MSDRRPIVGALSLALLAGLAAPAAPALVPGEDLVDLVPERTASLWYRAPDPSTRLADGYALEVVQAVVDARFDEFALDALRTLGVDEDLRLQVASVRNMLRAVGGLVPWRALAESELAWAESLDPPLSSDYGIPSMLLACRPTPDRRDEVVDDLSALFGTLAAVGAPFVRYDIQQEPGANGHGPTLHSLRVPACDDAEILQMGVAGDVVLLGMGSEYFGWAWDLASTGQGSPLTRAPRFRHAWGDLPDDAPSRTWVDVDALADGLEDAREMLLQREFAGGLFGGLVGDAFDLAAAVDSIATATRCEGDLLVTETLTRFDPDVAARQPVLAASLPTPASRELLDFVPADAPAFAMRGQVDLAPLYRRATQHLLATWDGAEAMLWALDTAQAAVDLSIERDLLTWLGSEHVRVEVPSRRIPGQVDSLWLCKLRDPRGARKVLGRLEAVYNAAVPRLLEELQAWLRQVRSPFVPRVALSRVEGMFPNLRQLEVRVSGLPVQPPTMTYGMIGDSLVVATSRDAIETAMLVAAGEEEGLSGHPLAAGLVGRDDLTGARLAPYGDRVREVAQTVAAVGGWTRGILGSGESHTQGARTFADLVGDLTDRVLGVLEVVDFVGNALVVSESREGGLARYERRVVRLLRPEERPSYGTRSRRETAPEPAPDAASVTRR